MKAFDLIDFDPRYNQAKDYSGRNVRMVRKIGGVYYESCVGTFSFRRIDYLHFQKRSVYDFDSDLIVSNGVYMISKPDRYRFIKFYFNRLKYHFKNGTLIRR